MSMSRSPRHEGRRRGALLAGGLVVVLLGAGVALSTRGATTGGAAAPVTIPTVDPRLVIPPRTIPVTAVLTGGAQARGTLFPAYPGRNVLRVVIRWRGSARSLAAPLLLTVTMPGMPMTPIHARLTDRDSRYAGTVTLPMLGTYRAALSLAVPEGHVTGTLILPLTIPHL